MGSKTFPTIWGPYMTLVTKYQISVVNSNVAEKNVTKNVHICSMCIKSKNATHNMVYRYDVCDQISDFCHQQLLGKMRQKISWTDGRTDRGKTVYPPHPSGSGGIKRTSYL